MYGVQNFRLHKISETEMQLIREREREKERVRGKEREMTERHITKIINVEIIPQTELSHANRTSKCLRNQ